MGARGGKKEQARADPGVGHFSGHKHSAGKVTPSTTLQLAAAAAEEEKEWTSSPPLPALPALLERGRA